MTPARWVVYSTYDAEGRAAPHASDQVREYRRLGFDVLVVDTSPRLSAARREAWTSGATAWFDRANTGYDFGSYRAGVDWLLESTGATPSQLALVLANDSCFGPYFPLDRVFDRFDAAPPLPRKVFGITDSLQYGHHLQSYWLYFRPDTAGLAVDFLRAMPTARDREEAIERGELGLGAYLREQGCELVAYCSIDDAIAALSRDGSSVRSFLELAVRRIAHRPKYNRWVDGQCLRRLLHRPNRTDWFNPAVLFGPHLLDRDMLPLVKRSIFHFNAYDDPRIPDGVDATTLDNAAAERLLRSADRRHLASSRK